MSDIINLLFCTVRPALENLEKSGVGHIQLNTRTDRDGLCTIYNIENTDYAISIEKLRQSENLSIPVYDTQENKDD